MKAGQSLKEALIQASAALKAAGVADPVLDARLLLCHALGVGRAVLLREPERKLDADEARRFAALIERRRRREPVSHLLGKREFWSLEFKVTGDVLDPRPDSETLVAGVLEMLEGRREDALRLLDLGSGSGCLLLSILSELPNATGLGIDISEAALRVARENATSLGLAGRAEFRRGDWLAGLEVEGRFDVVVSNPPYIPDAEVDQLEPEVARFEPRGALAGGADGLDCYRLLARGIGPFLARRGFALVEVGAGQAPDVGKLFAKAGFRSIEAMRDLAGIERCIYAADFEPA